MTVEEKRDYMEGLALKYKSSTMMRKEFCKEHGLAVGTLAYWVSKLNARQAIFEEVVPPKKPKAQPVAQKPAKAVPSEQLIEISLPNGVYIKLPADTPAHTLQALIAV